MIVPEVVIYAFAAIGAWFTVALITVVGLMVIASGKTPRT